MTLTTFAEQHRLKLMRDDCGDAVIRGKLGHLYEYNSTELGLCFMPADDPRTRLWNNTNKACLAAGMTLRQNGDAEGCLSFDPASKEQAKLAIKAVVARPKRQLSPEQLARLASVGFKATRPTVQEGLAV